MSCFWTRVPRPGTVRCEVVFSGGILGDDAGPTGWRNDPLTRRVDDPREGSLYPPRRTVGIPLGRFPSRFGPPPRVRQPLLQTGYTP
jgi:hypothetical protein